MFFVNYLPEFLYQPLKLSNVRPTDFANAKHAKYQVCFIFNPTTGQQSLNCKSIFVVPSLIFLQLIQYVIFNLDSN